MTGSMVFLRIIDRELVRSKPQARFVFGDNLARTGMGGQAAAMRGEPNAIGVVTKRYPSNDPSAFLRDEEGDILAIIDRDIDKVAEAMAEGRTVYVPLDGLGTGLAQLPTRAPAIHKHIVERFRAMSPKCPWSAP